MDPMNTISLMFGLVILTVTASILAPMTASGRLKRNTTVGIKTRHTLSSDEAWLAAHHHAAPTLKMTAWIGWILLAIAAVLCFMQKFPWALTVTAAGFCLSLLLLLVAGFRSNKIAKQYPSS
ncbi:SdpI/YhfL protein family protein [Arthrobacter sp. NIO-1057]|nr:SdpI/YhfL protein family protein [Arthrobacter sp. NIO-1057]